MNDQQIFECMARQDKIRAVQIADKLNEELLDVSNALKALVDEGDVVQSKGFQPNGLSAMVYDLSEAFKRGGEYKAIMERLKAEPMAVPSSLPKPVAAPEKPNGGAGKPKTSREPLPDSLKSELSIAGRGEAHIIEKGSCSDNDLRVVMGLSAGQYPSSYLGASVKAGRINKDGKDWCAGPGRDVKPAPLPSEFTMRKPQVGPVAKFESQTAAASAPVVSESAALQPEPQPAAQQLRCGIWSDGVVELQRGGSPIAFLSQDEADFMAAFMVRVGAKVAA